MPFFCEVRNQIAANQVESGVRMRWKIVPAVTEVGDIIEGHEGVPAALPQKTVEHLFPFGGEDRRSPGEYTSRSNRHARIRAGRPGLTTGPYRTVR